MNLHRSHICVWLVTTIAAIVGTELASVNRSTTAVVPADPWMNAAWLDRTQLTFKNAAQSSNLINFPVLVLLDSTRIDFSKTQNLGEDIRFTDSDGTPLAYEIEQWDESGTCFVWVGVPQVDASSSADYIWMYYNNSLASDAQDAPNVWDANYMLVWHMNESAGTTIADSTGNGNNGTKTSATEPNPIADGQTGAAQSYTAGSEDNVFKDGLSPPVALTLEAWIRPVSWDVGDDWSVIMHFQNEKPGIFVFENKLVFFRRDKSLQGTGVIPFSQWTHTAVAHAGATAYMYLNGGLDASGDVPKSDTGTDFQAGAWGNEGWWDGDIDEVRVSTIMRSADWIAAQYLSMTDGFIDWPGGGGLRLISWQEVAPDDS